MANLPAICDNCGTIFPSGFNISGGTGVMIGSKSGPCPRCGSWGHIPDGTYRIVENIIEVLSAPQRTIDELKRFSDLLQRTRNEEITAEELSSKVNSEVPSMSPALDLLPKTREEKRSDFKFLISAMIATIGILVPVFNDKNVDNPQEQIKIEQVINNIYEIEQYNTYNINKPIRVEKIGRNDPCSCGSGLKYKKCHGK